MADDTMRSMPNFLEVIRELKALQAKQTSGRASPADLARIAELQAYTQGQKKPDPAPVAPPPRPPAVPPAAAAPAPRPAAAPAAAARPAAAPAAAARPRQAAAEPEPDGNAFSLSLDGDLMAELGSVGDGEDPLAGAAVSASTHATGEIEDDANPFAISLDDSSLAAALEEDDSHAAKTTFEVEEEPVAKASGANPFALEIPEGLEGIGIDDGEGGVTHEVGEEDLAETADAGDPYKVALAADFEKKLAKSDGSGAAAPAKQPVGQPLVPDAHYEKLAANDNSVVVFMRDGRMAKGVAGGFTNVAPTFSLNQLVPGKPPVAIKLEDCLTVRYVRAYNGPLDAAKPFAAGPAPVTGERVSVKMLDGETIVGTAMPHKPGEPFFVVPAVGTGNVRRIWISPKAVRAATKV